MTTATLTATPDDPHGVRRRYQAEGFDALTAALEQRGPIKPAPYFEATTGPTSRRRNRVPRADLDVILSDAYLDYLLGNRKTRPTAAERLAA